MSPRVRALLIVTALVLGIGWAEQALRGWNNDRLGVQVAAVARPGDIRMLSTQTCVYCRQARGWFSAHRVPFDECFIEQDAACAQEFSARLAPGTPLLLVRGKTLIGFEPGAVLAALGSE